MKCCYISLFTKNKKQQQQQKTMHHTHTHTHTVRRCLYQMVRKTLSIPSVGKDLCWEEISSTADTILYICFWKLAVPIKIGWHLIKKNQQSSPMMIESKRMINLRGDGDWNGEESAFWEAEFSCLMRVVNTLVHLSSNGLTLQIEFLTMLSK